MTRKTTDSTPTKTSAKAPKKPVVEKDTGITKPEDRMTTNISQETARPQEAYRVKMELDPHSYVVVRNGFNGTLIYISSKTGEQFVWDGFGAEQEMELAELRNAKSSSKGFFENNWFLFDDPAVIAYLGVERLYKDSLKFDEFDELFNLTPEKITERISKMPKGQKYAVSYLAKQKIANGDIDSMKVINVLESSLGMQLIER